MNRIENLSKSYGELSVLENISVDIKKGEGISVIGPSGCGKSTFIRCLNLLEQPSGGKIWIDGEDILAKDADVSKLRRKMGMVFQSFNLFSHLMVIENVMLGPVELLKMDRQTAYDEGMKLLETVGLAGKAFAYPDELSGGQKQRAAIARTLAMKPEILLMDEPTSALDPKMVSEVVTVIRRLAQEGMTMMIVTHEMNLAKTVSTRVFYMDEKGIYEDGTPQQIFKDPQRPKTKEFIYKTHTYHRSIDRLSFDPYELWAGIEGFLKEYFLPPKRIRTTLLLCEELLYHLLFERLEEEAGPIQFDLEYSEAKDTIRLTFAAPQLRFTEDLPEDDLAMKIIRGYARELHCDEGLLYAEL